jgi:hypothetical protein
MRSLSVESSVRPAPVGFCHQALTRGYRYHARLRFATGAEAWAFAGFFFVVATASRLFFSASMRFTTLGGASTAGATTSFASNLRVDDALQPFPVFVLVSGQIEWSLEGLNDLSGEFYLLRLHNTGHGVQLFNTLTADSRSVPWRRCLAAERQVRSWRSTPKGRPIPRIESPLATTENQ